jgi:outer membrane protein OmpA-like peptidoglycan-associated protein
MKKMFILACVIAALGFAGCGKEKKKNKVVALNEVNRQEIPLCPSDEEKFFDFDGDEDGFDFIDSEDGKGHKVAEHEQFDEDWEEDLSLAWQDEPEDKDYKFKVVNFDLNKNTIRDDQVEAVSENVKLATAATKEGKNLIVAGHCCSLGSASFNMSLSEKRAKKIRDEMVKSGVPKDNVSILGCGSEHTIVASEAQDRQQRIIELSPNRRAEISIH